MSMTDPLIELFGLHEELTIQQMKGTMKEARYGAIMADGHPGYSMPIGGVAAYENKVNVAGVGVDIACGNCALKTNLHTDDWEEAGFRDIGFWIQDNIGMGMSGQVNGSYWAPSDHALFEQGAWDLIPREYRTSLKAKARNQLGTIGGGNHYIDILSDEDGFLWVGVHFGSRKFGYTVANAFVSMSQGGGWAERGDWENKSSVLDMNTQVGKDYWNLMQLAGDYAYAGREWVCIAVARAMGGHETDLVHNHHNFAWRERHFDEDLIVVRKGATPAWPEQRGFVGGSMGDDCVILKGRSGFDDNGAQRLAMYSTIHGAGRVRSRNATRGKVNRKKGIIKSPGLFSVEDVRHWIKDRKVLVFGADIDEGPQAYRRLADVLPEQRGTIEIEHTLRPLLVAMDRGYSGDNPFLMEFDK